MPVAADQVPYARAEQDSTTRGAGRSQAVDHHFDLAQLLTHHLQRVQQGGQDHHRRAVLIIVHHGNIERFLEPFLDVEAARSTDVFQVDAAEGGGDRGDGPYDRVG